MRLQEKDLEILKKFMTLVLPTYEDGATFGVTDLQKTTFKESHLFDLPGVKVGNPIVSKGIAEQAIGAQHAMSIRIDRNVYGIRVLAYGGPVWSNAGDEIVGSWFLAAPRQHGIVKTFDSFAPVLADALPEGGVIWITDKERYLKRQSSDKFDIPAIQIKTPLNDDSAQHDAMKTGKIVTREMSASAYGVPIRSVASPVVDGETGEIVGTFGLTLPRQLAANLKEISGSLGSGLSEVATAIGQITIATNDISQNQQQLHGDIEKVKILVNKINDVMAFIKEIADETKMLGLNAAIEAARVGDAGRGFGVVAEEIRKLSEESKKTVVQIRDLTQQIHQAMNATSAASESTLAVVEENAAATEESNASLEEMTSLAQKLAKEAEML